MSHQSEPDSDRAETGTANTNVRESGSAQPDVAESGSAQAELAENSSAQPHAAERSAAAVTPAPEPDRRETGEPRVDAALTLLDRLTELPVTEHAAVFEQVHAELSAVLGQLDPESAGPGD